MLAGSIMRYSLRLAALIAIAAPMLVGCSGAPGTSPLVVDATNGVSVAQMPAMLVGGIGETPGRLQHVGPIAVQDDGSMIVADGVSKRLTWFGVDGAVSRSASLYPGEETSLAVPDSIKWVNAIKYRDGALHIVSGSAVWRIADGAATKVELQGFEGYIRDLEVCGAGRLYALLDDRLVVFEADGTKVLESAFTGGEGNPSARDMAIGPDEDLYVAARRWGKILVVDHGTGELVRTIGEPGQGPGQFARSARAVAVDEFGNVYAYDDGDNTISVFSSDGAPVGEFLTRGSRAGETLGVGGLVVDSGGRRLLIADYANYRVQVYDLTGGDAAARDLVLHEAENGPTLVPDCVTLQLGDDPVGERRITWRTDMSATGSVAQVAEVDAAGDMVDWDNAAAVRAVEGDTVSHYSNLGPYVAHSVSFTGLIPGAVYAYRVGDASPRGWSEVSYFGVPAGTDDGLKAIVLGDSRNRMDVWQSVVSQAADRGPAFIINTGDLVSDGERLDHWNAWFHSARTILNRVPLMTCIGNHERQSMNYLNLFSLPENGPEGLIEQAYYFDYGPARWIVVNTEVDLVAQAEWMEKVLQDNPHPWAFAFLHRPAWAGHPHRGTGSQDVRDAWAGLFEQYGVEIAWQGHDHYYYRTKALRGDEVVASGEAPIYVTSGGAGAPLYPIMGTDFAEVYESVDHYCVLDLTAERAHVTVYRADGSVLDDFTLEPRAPIASGDGM